MKKFGLIGFPLSHSFSEKYFSNKFIKEGIKDCEYKSYPLENIEMLSELIDSNKELVGLNVTIPHKEKVLHYLTDIDADAKEIGAVNTIHISRNGSNIVIKGYNTDVYGFKKPLVDKLSSYHKSALILGTGGASKAVAWVLKSLNINYAHVSRKPVSKSDYSYDDLTEEILEKNLLIINTSPIGMYPKDSEYPNLPYGGISEKHILYDLIYNPELTSFLKKGQEKRASLINGLPMLYLQAEKSWEIWNNS